MRKKITSVIIGLIFLVGLGILLYPTVSNLVNEHNQSKVVAGYSEAVSGMSETDYTARLAAAEVYNEKIAQAGSLAAAVRMENANHLEEYNSLLNVAGNSVMGVIRIPKIKVSLPIYHTTEDAVLQVGVGHFTGSSLPVGGENTHCILSGHRGLPSAKLFTDLDQIVEGDQFYMDVLGDTLAYQVDQVSVVLPEEVEALDVTPGQDYVTLVTCTPYGVNSHRLLIRGTRVPYVPEETGGNAENGVMQAVQARQIPWMPVFAVSAVLFALVAGSWCGGRSRKKSGKKRSSGSGKKRSHSSGKRRSHSSGEKRKKQDQD